MTRQRLINDIRRLNPSAAPEFLAQFSENELDQYLRRLLSLERRYGEVLPPVAVEDLALTFEMCGPDRR